MSEEYKEYLEERSYKIDCCVSHLLLAIDEIKGYLEYSDLKSDLKYMLEVARKLSKETIEELHNE